MMIQKIEELSMNAWPSFQTMINDGWILRFADGCTKRSNSINPIYSSNTKIDHHVSECEKIYTKKKMPTIFKLTEQSESQQLDAYLNKNGYKEEANTNVQLLELNQHDGSLNPGIELSNAIEAPWEKSFYRLNNIKPEHQPTHGKILRNIIPSTCFAKIRNSENKIVGCGLGVIEADYLGLFDIVIDEQYRRMGFGKILVENIILWGKNNGAKTAYLQVMENNEAALRLYSKLGFRKEYSYWYRVINQ